MYEYKVEFSYLQEGKRVKDKDWFTADSAQEAADDCRYAYFQEFSLQEGRIENVYRLTALGWELRSNWD